MRPRLHARHDSLIHPGNALGYQKFFQALSGIEPAPSAVLDTAVWQGGFVVDGHTVDMDSATSYQYAFQGKWLET